MTPAQETRQRWYHSLSWRLTLWTTLAMVVTQLGGLLMIHWLGSTASRNTARESMLVADRVAGEVLHSRATQLTDGAAVLAKDFGFRAAMATGDRDTIASALENSAARVHADIALLLDTDGAPVVAVPALDRDILAGISKGMRNSTAPADDEIRVLAVGKQLYQMVAVSVRAPTLIGSVMLGFSLDRAVVNQIGEIAESDITVVEGEPASGLAARASTLPRADQALVVAAPAAGRPTPAGGGHVSLSDREFQLSKGTYLASYRALGHEIGTGRSVGLLLNRSVDSAMKPFLKLWQAWCLYALFMTVATACVIALVARGIASRLAVMGLFARRVAGGQFDSVPPSEGLDEIGDLSRAFEHMQQGIAAREQRIRKLAYEDTLTGLANRTQLQESIDAMIADAPEVPLAVFLLDLDRFRFVNEVLEHSVGDKVLGEVGKRLQTLERFGAVLVSRLGGDEFALSFTVAGPEEAITLGEHITEVLSLPIVLDDMQVDAGASIGIAMYPQHGSSAQALLRCADMAMYHAKDNTASMAMFEPSLAHTNSSSLSLLSELRHAVEANELVLYFQPKLDLSGHGKRAMEALVRWNHPTHGFVPPMNFIPFAEETGFIRNITQWVLNASMVAAADWHHRGLPVQVAVNISARDLMKPELPDEVTELLSRTGCDAHWILLEVTESALASDLELALDNLHKLRALGCDIAIDDYGTDYSSLKHLQQLPVTELKIDKGFVMNMLQSQHDESIVSYTIDLAHRLGLRVTAEGVDSREALERLKSFGCDTAQGFYLSRPVPIAAAETWYREGMDQQHLRTQPGRARLTLLSSTGPDSHESEPSRLQAS